MQGFLKFLPSIMYFTAARVLDQAARKGLIHKNNAARQKSRLAALVKKLKAKAS